MSDTESKSTVESTVDCALPGRRVRRGIAQAHDAGPSTTATDTKSDPTEQMIEQAPEDTASRG